MRTTQKRIAVISVLLILSCVLSGCLGSFTRVINNEADTETTSYFWGSPVSPEGDAVPEGTKDQITTGQRNALRAARSYLNFTPFSYEGLVGQLEYEGYTNDEAKYAADNCGADWNEQALKDALNYLDYTAFSYSGLVKQLEFEKYTSSQVKYAADNCGANWYEQAAKRAASYLDMMAFSRQGLIDQLEFEGFTYDQAVYGVEQNGY